MTPIAKAVEAIIEHNHIPECRDGTHFGEDCSLTMIVEDPQQACALGCMMLAGMTESEHQGVLDIYGKVYGRILWIDNDNYGRDYVLAQLKDMLPSIQTGML